MPTRTVRLGDRDLARMGLGTNRLTSSPDRVAFIRDAVASGIGMIDTAHLYSGGSSEQTVGDAFPGGTDDAIVATKGGYRPGEGRPDVLRQQIDESLRRLQTDRIPLWYLHRVDPQTPLEQTLGVVREYVDAGRIGLVGISDVDVKQIERARSVVPIAAVQNEYHLSERRFDPVVDHCEREGIVFVPFHPVHGDSERLADIARAHDATQTQIMLAWLLHRSPAMLPIPGTLSLGHVRDNVAALEIELTEEEFAALS